MEKSRYYLQPLEWMLNGSAGYVQPKTFAYTITFQEGMWYVNLYINMDYLWSTKANGYYSVPISKTNGAFSINFGDGIMIRQFQRVSEKYLLLGSFEVDLDEIEKTETLELSDYESDSNNTQEIQLEVAVVS